MSSRMAAASACRPSRWPGFALERSARCHCGRTRSLHGDRAVNDLLLRRILTWDLVRQRRGGRRGHSPGRSASRAPHGVNAQFFSPARRNSANSRSGTFRGAQCGPRALPDTLLGDNRKSTGPRPVLTCCTWYLFSTICTVSHVYPIVRPLNESCLPDSWARSVSHVYPTENRRINSLFVENSPAARFEALRAPGATHPPRPVRPRPPAGRTPHSGAQTPRESPFHQTRSRIAFTPATPSQRDRRPA